MVCECIRGTVREREFFNSMIALMSKNVSERVCLWRYMWLLFSFTCVGPSPLCCGEKLLPFILFATLLLFASRNALEGICTGFPSFRAQEARRWARWSFVSPSLGIFLILRERNIAITSVASACLHVRTCVHKRAIKGTQYMRYCIDKCMHVCMFIYTKDCMK